MYYNFRHHSLIAVTLLLPVHIMAHDATATKELASISIEATDVLSSASSEGYYQPIVNGATRTDVPLLELPQSVKVITEETLDDLNAFRINDALDFVSGVSRQNNFGGTWDNIAVRGFAGNENTGMSMMRNGFSSNRGINPPRDMANVQSIEFLKGPSAALYGNSEPGGTLNIVTKKPEFKSKHAVDASIGSYDFYRVAIDSTAALSSNFAYRLNVAQEDKGSFRDYIDSSRTLIAPAFTWLMNNKTTLSYDGEFLRQKAPLDRGLVSIDGDTAAVPIENFLGNPADGDITLNSQNHQLSLTHEITDEWDAHIGVAHKRGSLEGLASEVRPFTIVTGDSVNLRTRYRDYQTTDTTLQADVHGKLKEHDLLIGTEIYQFTNDQILNNRNNKVTVNNILTSPTYTVNAGALTATTNTHDVQNGVAFFAQDNISLTQNWKVLVGLRHDQVKTDYNNNLNQTQREQKDSAITSRLGTSYLLDKEWSIYASAGQSFRPNASTDANGNPFDPEKGLAYESGIKYEAIDKSLGATLCVFDIEKKNVLTGSDVNGIYSSTSGKVRSRGIEADIAGKITPFLRIQGNYALLDTKILEDQGGQVDFATSQIINLEGKALPNIAKHSGSFLTMWDESYGANKAWGIGGAVTYVGSRQGNVINSFTLPSYTTLKALSYWKIDHNWKLNLTIDNLLDEEYIASSYDRSWLTPGAPRTATLTAQYTF
jgi:iron complex outermembrane receptor protein